MTNQIGQTTHPAVLHLAASVPWRCRGMTKLSQAKQALYRAFDEDMARALYLQLLFVVDSPHLFPTERICNGHT